VSIINPCLFVHRPSDGVQTKRVSKDDRARERHDDKAVAWTTARK